MNKLRIGQEVELAPGMETVYVRGAAGMRGTILGITEDPDGFELVYIEWDKGHWRYNGEEDDWTYALHFRPVGTERPHLGPEVDDIPTVPNIVPSEEEETYIDSIMAACDKASEADGFYFVTLKRDEEDRIVLEILHAAIDADLNSLSGADVFSFLEHEMRQRGL